MGYKILGNGPRKRLWESMTDVGEINEEVGN